MDIFKMNLSSECKLILLYLQEKQQATITDISSILNKSIRTAYRHISELGSLVSKSQDIYILNLSNLSPCSSNIIINNTRDINTTTTSDYSVIADILDKYNMKALYNDVIKRIPEPNSQAVEFILLDCRRKINSIKNFAGYFLVCLEKMWSQAIISIKTIIDKPEVIIPAEKEIVLPDAEPESLKVWNEMIETSNATIFVKNAYLKTAVPLEFKDDILTLQVQNELAKIKIVETFPNKIRFIF